MCEKRVCSIGGTAKKNAKYSSGLIYKLCYDRIYNSEIF